MNKNEDRNQRVDELCALVPRDVCLKALKRTETRDNEKFADQILVAPELQDIEVARQSASMLDLPPVKQETLAQVILIQQIAGKKGGEIPRGVPENEQVLLEEEVLHIVTTIVTTWLEALHIIRCQDVGVPHQPVRLTNDLLPVLQPVSLGGSFTNNDSWLDIFAHHLCSVLNPDDVETVFRAFAERLRQEVDKNQSGYQVIQIDNVQLEICKDDQGYFLAPLTCLVTP